MISGIVNLCPQEGSEITDYIFDNAFADNEMSATRNRLTDRIVDAVH